METRPNLALFWYLLVFISADEDIPEITTLCPFNNFCKNESKYLLEADVVPCCQKCSCSDWCYEMGTCCYDKFVNVSSSLPITPPMSQCINTNMILNTGRIIVSGNLRPQRDYRIISRCPDTYSALRHPRCQDPKDLEDYIVVSDAQLEVHFRNRHCAKCNGVTDVTKWRLLAECPEIMTMEFESFQQRDDYILRKCPLGVDPPHYKVEELAQCNPGVYVSTCSSNRQSVHRLYDIEKLERACNKRNPYLNTRFQDTDGLWYANVYCYLCNNPDQVEIPLMCPIETPSVDVSFSAVIGELASDSGETNGPCKVTEVQDEFTGICRRLLCPMSTVPVKGKCVNAVKYAHGFTLYVLFEIEFLEGNVSSYIQIILKIENYINNLQKTSITGCGLCEMQLFQSQSTLLFRVPFYTTENCSVPALIEHVRSLVTRNANSPPLVFNGKNGLTSLVLKLYQKKMPSVDIYHHTSFLGDRCILRPLQIDRMLLQDCPHFHLSVDSLFKLNSYNSSIEAYLNPHGYVSICADTYFHLNGQSSTASVVPVLCQAAMVVAILFTFV